MALLIFAVFLLSAKTTNAATEFISIVDPDNAVGTDYTSLSAWEAAIKTNLTATSTLVFSITNNIGTTTDGATTTGQTSGAVGRVKHLASSSRQILIEAITGTFRNGEVISTGVGTTTLTATGTQAIAVAKCRSTGGSADTTRVLVSGWTTSSSTNIKIWTDPTDPYGRHLGKWNDQKYRLETSDSGDSLSFSGTQYVKIDGLQIKIKTNNYEAVSMGYIGGEYWISNLIIQGNGNVSSGIMGIYSDSTLSGIRYIYNNIIYNLGSGNTRCIATTGNGSFYIYNNTCYGAYLGYRAGSSNSYNSLKNNIAQNNTIDYASSTNFDVSANNLSSDSTATGTGALINKTVQFVDSSNYDFHLSESDTTARNAGTSTVFTDTNLNFATDIDGTARGASPDIGADEVPVEYVSTICASGATDCSVTADYNSLSTWESVVNSDIATNTTRVFSGTITGSLSSGNTVTLWENSTTTNITASVVATTTAGQILLKSITLPSNASSSNIIYIDGVRSLLYTSSGSYWRKDASNYFTVSGTNDSLGASVQVTAKIDGTWASAETSSITINGWTTDSDNFVKVYTTATARHHGKWNTSESYRITTTSVTLTNNEEYVIIDGLQLQRTSSSGEILYSNIIGGNNSMAVYSNNIIKGIYSGATAESYGIVTYGAHNFTAFNNIIYGIKNGSSDQYGGIRIYNPSGSVKGYVYNNTIYDSYVGIICASPGGCFVKNNLVASTTDPFLNASSFHASSVNNATDINDMPIGGSNNFINQTFSFVSTVSGVEDFHLEFTDTGAKDKGTNLANDGASSSPMYSATYPMNGLVDIDGGLRNPDGLGWDIGADEVPVKIYRSIAPSATTALTTGASNAVTISSSTRLATFASALADNIGVGDVIVYNTNSSATSTAFISGRSSNTVYTLQTASGTAPTVITNDTTWSIYRAYTTLANAETGTENTGIPSAVRNFDTWSGGKNLVSSTSNEQWNIAAYANGTTADTDAVTISGWTTASQNYIKIYTPTKINEVGTSQRHQGKWDDNKYNLSSTSSDSVYIQDDHVQISGLQIKIAPSSSNLSAVSISSGSGANIIISDNLFRRSGGTGGFGIRGIYTNPETMGNRNLYIYNNIIYDFIGILTLGSGIYLRSGWTAYVYNNTIRNSDYAFVRNDGTFVVKNNIVQNCTDGYDGTFDSASDNNISDIAGDAPNATFATTSKIVQFVDSANKDFHLSPSDTSAINSGTSSIITDLTNVGADPEIINDIKYDIDGHLRRSYDIGADEASIEFVSAIKETGGDFSTLASWEDANDVDLTATSTAVFSCSTATGTIPYNSAIIGETSRSTASSTVMSTTTNQILLYNITASTSRATATSEFISGEKLHIVGGSTTTNYCIISSVGDPAIAVAKIDGSWTTADTNAVTIDGWTTGPNNYVKVYTTATARHLGKWDDTKYRVYTASDNSTITIGEDFIIIDGLQIEDQSSGSWNAQIGSNSNSSQRKIIIKNNIIRNIKNTNYGIALNGDNTESYVYNNIIYDTNKTGSEGYFLQIDSGGDKYVYNNTLNTCVLGIVVVGNEILAKNNIVQNCTDGYSGTFDSSSSNNISDLSNDIQQGSDNKNSTTVQFLDATNYDFHLSESDTAARNAGINLSSDPVFTADASSMPRDIDNQFRHDVGWDIGADEAATKIYRSVGWDTSDLSLSGKTVTITVATNTATAEFSAEVPANIGVGDAIQYGTPYQLAFITSRISSSTYEVQSAIGSAPVAVTATSSAVYRSHLRLDDWEDHILNDENSSIDTSVDDLVSVGFSQDLVASNTIMMVPCYASTTADNLTATIDGWTTATTSYIKIYTPTELSEVGITQRHSGIWNDNQYRMVVADGHDIDIQDNFVTIEGLQLRTDLIADGVNYKNIMSNIDINADNKLIISKNIITTDTESNGYNSGIYFSEADINFVLTNNIIYNFIGPDMPDLKMAIYIDNVNTGIIYNNTMYGNYDGIYRSNGSLEVKNNVVFDNVNDFTGTFTTLDYNASDDGDGTHAVDISPNANEAADWRAAFADYENGDLTPRNQASVIFDAGTTISLVNDDILGNSRPLFVRYDLGAIELTDIESKYRLKGSYKIKGSVKFE